MDNAVGISEMFFADGNGTPTTHNCCRLHTVDTLTEGFELLVLLFFLALFFCCLGSVTFSLWRQTALCAISHYAKFCESFLDHDDGQKAHRDAQSHHPRVGESTAEMVTDDRLADLLCRCPRTGIPKHGVRHLAVIMDGNRRFGKRSALDSVSVDAVTELCESILQDNTPLKPWDTRYMSLISLLRHTALDGHRQGGEKLMEFIDISLEFNIQMLTVYAFSTENWERPVLEVNVLMLLFYFFFERIRQSAKEKGIFIRFISPAFERISPRLQELMIHVEEESRKHRPRRIIVNVCVSYSGREEVLRACNRLMQRGDKNTPISNAQLMGQMLRSITQEVHDDEDATALADSGGVEPQVLLRTSGEKRLSNFMLYECAYTEFVFLDKTWPEVERSDLIQLLWEFAQRDKRHGK